MVHSKLFIRHELNCIGDYLDTVDCDVAYGSHLNNYSFMYNGVHHMLKPMPDSAIKAKVFATLKVKKKVAKITPKPKMALLQRRRMMR